MQIRDSLGKKKQEIISVVSHLQLLWFFEF